VTGDDVGYRTTGTVVAAWDAADLAALHDLHDFQCELGLGASLLTGRELRELEPNLAPGLPGGVYVAGDHQVDPRRLHAALRSAAVAAGVAELRTGVRKLRTQRERTTGVALDDGSVLDAGEVVLAAGAWATQLDGLPPGAVPGIRPVKGQTLQLREPPGVPAVAGHVVRGTVRGAPVYLLPRDGSIVVGASSEEVGFDLRPRAGAVYELLRDAQALLPAIGELELVEVSTGLRPATEDNAPVLGPTDVDGLVLAVGHYRNGVLLAPVTADLVAALLAGQLEEKDAELLAAFGAQRFAATAGATR
jgi:glycine oxidase